MGKYFTVYELVKSETGIKKHINNTPSDAQEENMIELIKYLDQIREKYGKPIYVNSGFRCPKLNAMVGGSKTSSHMSGLAADLDTNSREENQKLWDLIVEMGENGFKWDQLINESNLAWVHFSIGRGLRQQTFAL